MIFGDIFKLKEKTTEIKKDLFVLESKVPLFNLYIDLNRKTISISLDEEFHIKVFHHYSIPNNEKNLLLINDIVKKFKEVTVHNLSSDLKIRDTAVIINEYGFDIFLEPMTLELCEDYIYKIIKESYKNLNTILDNLEVLSEHIIKHQKLSNVLDESKDEILNKIITKVKEECVCE